MSMNMDKASEMRDGFAHMVLFMGHIAESSGQIAHTRKALFDAYVSEGFTEQQALTLTAAPIFQGGMA